MSPLAYLYSLFRRLPSPLRQPSAHLFRFMVEPVTGYPLGGMLTGFAMHRPVPEIYRTGQYEPKTSQLISLLVQPGWTCIDVGAHIGYYTLLMAKAVGQTGRVIAIEAHPVNVSHLQSNVRLNHLETSVDTIHAAVTNGLSPIIQLYSGRASASTEWNTLGYDVEQNPTTVALDVKTLSLDNLIHEKQPLHLIKMDIEGAENLAVDGMKRILSNQRPVIVIELHNQEGQIAAQKLIEANYQLYTIKHNTPIEDVIQISGIAQYLALPGESAHSLLMLLNSIHPVSSNSDC